MSAVNFEELVKDCKWKTDMGNNIYWCLATNQTCMNAISNGQCVEVIKAMENNNANSGANSTSK